MAKTTILILGGSGEGFQIATMLAADERFHPISSLAGRTPAPRVPAGTVRRGGFGGTQGLADYLKLNAIDAVIDATHPFANSISDNASSACRQSNVPCVHIWRLPWIAVEGDRWHEVTDMQSAADAIPESAKGVFLTTGKTELASFAHRRDVEFIARIVAPLSPEENALPRPPHLTLLYDKGPFDDANELGLLREHEVEWLVTKNSGGSAAYAKLNAARALGLPVIMVQRPKPPSGTRVETVDEALSWLQDINA